MFSHEEMPDPLDFQQEDQSLSAWKNVCLFCFLSFVSRGFIPSGQTFECISEGTGRRESVVFQNVENDVEPEYQSSSNDRIIRLILH